MTRTGFAWLAFVAAPWLLLGLTQQKPKPSFTQDIAPVLKSKCVSCHGPDVQAADLRLDTPEGIRKGGVSGKLFEPMQADKSLLISRLLGHGGKPKMPMGFAPLTPEVIGKFKAWIDGGAVFETPGKVKHWAYASPVRPMVPAVNGVTNPIDAFVRARLDKEGVKPSPEASPEVLARRVALDLTGLPPTVEELDRFLNDKKPGAYERYVDRLLTSPHYGERMARAWLDLARYADTNGYEKDLPRQMWPWRDWLISAFNRNLPYDEFTVEQLAGDLLPQPTRDQLVATGFHRNSMLNDEGGIDAEEFRVVAVLDRVDATATTWLGITMACAQCHDHKYDPFSQRDYYRFFSFFNQSQDNGRDMTPLLPLPGPGDEAGLKKIDDEIAKAQKTLSEITPAAMQKRDEWQRAVREDWRVLRPTSATGQATLTVLDDASVLASGADPDADIYTVTMPLDGLSSIAGLRIEAIPDRSLPEGSSGRNFNGNFVLRRVVAKVVHADGSSVPVKFASARATVVQGGHDAQSTITEGDGPGWAIAGFEPKNRVRQALVATADQPLAVASGDRLVVELQHQTKHAKHNVGRFRISATANVSLAAQAPVPANIYDILEKPEPTDSDRNMIIVYYSRSAPELAPVKEQIAGFMRQKAELEQKLPTVMVMRDLQEKRPDRILKRGDFRTPGDSVTPGSPTVLGGRVSREDRLGLAKWIVDPKNPLTARVEVNRLWEQCFGRGLVATPEDFGVQGERPSHPELLDWLATEFMRRKWDVKSTLKLIVTSATYKQSSRVSRSLLKKDPYNVLLARGSRFRVDAEGVRDIALQASGLMNPQIGGPSVMPPQPPGIWENSFSFYDTKERWVDAVGPQRFRRGMYTYWRRTAPYPMALTFDVKSRDVCVAQRSRTNTPLQALNMLNDPVFFEAAGRLGVVIDKKGIAYAFRAATSRKPSAKELAALEKLRKATRARYVADAAKASALLRAAGITEKSKLTTEIAASIVVANAILNLDEAITRG